MLMVILFSASTKKMIYKIKNYVELIFRKMWVEQNTKINKKGILIYKTNDKDFNTIMNRSNKLLKEMRNKRNQKCFKCGMKVKDDEL